MSTELYWPVFSFIILFLMVLDLGVFNKNDHVISLKESLLMSFFYISVGCGFGVYIYYIEGISIARDYFTGFILEKAMSLDNIFVMSIIFGFFKIPPKYQHRVLFYGILGVIILRGIMISAGAILITKFSWIMFIFALVLIYTGLKTLYIAHDNGTIDVKDLYIYKLLKNKLNICPELHGNKFLVKINKKWFLTPLAMSLITIEAMDLVFAIDSIPAIFAITQNGFIVYTSNIFAILGLRALFFCLVNIVERFKYLKYSIAIILIFIGIKIFISHFIKIPSYVPFTVMSLLIIGGIIISIIEKKSKTTI